MKFVNQLNTKGPSDDEGYYESVRGDGAELSVGDWIVWSDPDAGMHVGECELVHEETWVAQVKQLWKNYNTYSEEYELKIGVDAPLGWISWDDIAIPGEKGNWTFVADGGQRQVEQFEASEYVRWMATAHHLGKDGVPEDLWNSYDKHSRGGDSGPHCEYCVEGKPHVRGE